MNNIIIIEGPDKSGKSTLCRKLKKYYDGLEYPTEIITEIPKYIKEIKSLPELIRYHINNPTNINVPITHVREYMVQLFLINRKYNIVPKIKYNMENNIISIIDRFNLSTIIYGTDIKNYNIKECIGLYNKYNQDMDINVQKMSTIVLIPDDSILEKRYSGNKQNDMYENLERSKLYRNKYKDIASRLPDVKTFVITLQNEHLIEQEIIDYLNLQK